VCGVCRKWISHAGSHDKKKDILVYFFHKKGFFPNIASILGKVYKNKKDNFPKNLRVQTGVRTQGSGFREKYQHMPTVSVALLVLVKKSMRQ